MSGTIAFNAITKICLSLAQNVDKVSNLEHELTDIARSSKPLVNLMSIFPKATGRIAKKNEDL